jgi:hypothetical protein
LRVQLPFVLTFDLFCPIQFPFRPFRLFPNLFCLPRSCLPLFRCASRAEFRRIRAGMSKPWGGACRICGVTALLLHVLGGPLRGVAFPPCVLACPRRLVVCARRGLASTHCRAVWGCCVGLGRVLDHLRGIVMLCVLSLFALAVACLLRVLAYPHCLAARAHRGFAGSRGFICIGLASCSCRVLAGDLMRFRRVSAGLRRRIPLPLPHCHLFTSWLYRLFPCLALSLLCLVSPCLGVCRRCRGVMSRYDWVHVRVWL